MGSYVSAETMRICDMRGWGHLTGKGGGLALSEEKAIAIQEANARLIAAAPDLLEAVKSLRDGAYGNPSYPEDNDRIDALADAAIAKAEWQ